MRIGMCLGAVLLAVGCGPPDFNGRYRGKMDAVGSCTGSRSLFVEDAVWILTETSTGLQVALVGGVSCSTLKAPTPTSNVARITPRTCNSFVVSDLTVTESVREGGTMTLTGDTLKVAFDVFAALRHADGRTGGCNDSVGGTLTR